MKDNRAFVFGNREYVPDPANYPVMNQDPDQAPCFSAIGIRSEDSGNGKVTVTFKLLRNDESVTYLDAVAETPIALPHELNYQDVLWTAEVDKKYIDPSILSEPFVHLTLNKDGTGYLVGHVFIRFTRSSQDGEPMEILAPTNPNLESHKV